MRNTLSHLLVVVLMLYVVGGCSSRERPVVKIGKITLSAAEFEKAFKASDLFADKASGRRKFLERFIATRLILQEAVDANMDKDPDFLYGVQMFWEQSLLKSMIAKKTKDLMHTVKIDDKTIQEYYQNNREQYFPGKDLAEAYDQIKWLLFKEAQNKAVEQWVDALKTRIPIEADYKRLGIEP